MSRALVFRLFLSFSSLLLGLACLSPSIGFAQETTEDSETLPLGEREVRIEVKIGDEVTQFAPLTLPEGEAEATVETLMKRLAETERRWSFEARGEGELFFVTKILGRENEGRGGRNWILLINGEKSPRGAGSAKVGGQTVITWTYMGGGSN